MKDQKEVLEHLIAITKDHFRDSGVKINRQTSSADVPGWNSLNHVMLISRIEKELDIKFDLLQMIDMKSVEDIAAAAEELLANK